MLSSNPLDLVITLSIFILAIGIHEAAHAYAAHYLGDSTPEQEGRLSLNPVVHLDMMGTLMMVIAGFGWGKSVNVNPRNLSKPDQHMALISAAGPLSNLALMLLCTLLIIPLRSQTFLLPTLQHAALINGMLFLLNLLPIPPLDGSKIIRIFLPRNVQMQYDDFAPYGFIVLLALFFLPGARGFTFFYLWQLPNMMVQGILSLFF